MGKLARHGDVLSLREDPLYCLGGIVHAWGGEAPQQMHVRVRKAQPVGTLSRTLRILELICDSPKGLRLKEISERTGFNKSTAYRFLAHLEREGYLVRNGSQAYVLGIRFIEMAARGNWVEGLRSIAWPWLLDLQRASPGYRLAEQVVAAEINKVKSGQQVHPPDAAADIGKLTRE